MKLFRKQPKRALDIVPYSRSSAGFRGGNDVDIVGVTGSIPVTPTIRTSEIIDKFGAASAACVVLGRFIKPVSAIFDLWSRFAPFPLPRSTGA